MEKQKLSSVNKQQAMVYTLVILHIILSISGLLLNYLTLKNHQMYEAIICLNIVAVLCFGTWKMGESGK